MSFWTSWPLNMGPIRRPETSVKYYHSTLHYTQEQRSSRVAEGLQYRASLWISRTNLYLTKHDARVSFISFVGASSNVKTPCDLNVTFWSSASAATVCLTLSVVSLGGGGVQFTCFVLWHKSILMIFFHLRDFLAAFASRKLGKVLILPSHIFVFMHQ
jgi:hypothetical protein